METILGNSTKVLVDVDGGNNMMYLPLDKIMQNNVNSAPLALPNQNDINHLRSKLSPTSRNQSTTSSDDRFANDRFSNGR
jgi:membrane protease subunit HflK